MHKVLLIASMVLFAGSSIAANHCGPNKQIGPNDDCICKVGYHVTKDNKCVRCSPEKIFNQDTHQCEKKPNKK